MLRLVGAIVVGLLLMGGFLYAMNLINLPKSLKKEENDERR